MQWAREPHSLSDRLVLEANKTSIPSFSTPTSFEDILTRSREAKMAEIVFLRRGEEVMRYNLDDYVTPIGRGSSNDIVLPEHHADVAHHHVQIERQAGSFFLRDLSGKGLELNGEPRSEAALKDQDSFFLGGWEIRFRSGRGEGRKGLVSQRDSTLPITSEGELNAPAEAILRYTFQNRPYEVALGKHAVNIGKYDSNQVCIPEPYISGFHCRIYHKSGRFFVRDLDSKNGTWLNGLRIVEGEIPDGAEIRLGMMPLKFSLQNVQDDKDEAWPGFSGIITQDPQMFKLFDILKRLAGTDAPVLIQGESGTGKELFARALHEESNRKAHPFVPMNCGAISAELVESTLFGHEKGAFTGALQTRVGLFEEAGQGTLFLDEIGDLPLAQQVAFLRVLQLGTFRRVGGQKELQSHSRIVTATHRDLHHLVADGSFREDLLYRISVLHLAIPPLRERPEDIALLARYFLNSFAGQRGLRFSQSALDALQSYSWPGNVRELRNVIQRAIVFVQGYEITTDFIQFRPSHRSFAGLSSPPSSFSNPHSPPHSSPAPLSYPSPSSLPAASETTPLADSRA